MVHVLCVDFYRFLTHNKNTIIYMYDIYSIDNKFTILFFNIFNKIVKSQS